MARSGKRNFAFPAKSSTIRDPVDRERTGQPDITGNEWSIWGIQFDAIGGTGSYLYLPEAENHSPAHALYDKGGYATSYGITFSVPVWSFGTYIVDNETTSPNEDIIVTDTTGYSKVFEMPVGGANESFFRGYRSDAPIVEAQFIEDLSDGEGMLLDDVMFNPVPVPGALLLGIFGLSVAGMKLRKHA